MSNAGRGAALPSDNEPTGLLDATHVGVTLAASKSTSPESINSRIGSRGRRANIEWSLRRVPSLGR
jgi:hypothetical protein